MAWLVSNWCTIQREVQIADFYKDEQKAQALPCNPIACTLESDVSPGRIKVINCFVLEEDKRLEKYHYVIKLDKSTVVDPELIIKR